MSSRAQAVDRSGAELRQRGLVLLVGSESESRRELAGALIDHGFAAVTCSGPPGCVLLREDRCALADVADVTVIMPVHSSRREIVAALSLCVREAVHPVIVEPAVVEHPPPSAEMVTDSGTDQILAAVERVIEHQRCRSRPKKGVADAADIWL